MVKPRRIEINEGVYHIYNRFIDGQKFFDTTNYKAFIYIFQKSAQYFNIDTLLITCMPTHFHSIIQIHQPNLSAFLQKYGTAFARYINYKEKRKGHVFQNRHQSKLITSDEYFLNCLSYIILNPVRAGLCDKPEQYPYTDLKNILIANNSEKYDVMYNMFHQERHAGRRIFRKWIHTADINNRYNELITVSSRQVNGDNIENKYIFSSINRREEIRPAENKQRAEDFADKSASIERIINIVNKHKKKHAIKHIWKSDHSFERHLKWYLLRNYCKLELKEIAHLDRISRHTTISEGIRGIERNSKKKAIIDKIIRKEDL